MPEDLLPVFPVCTACGSEVSDELAQFCNRCGLKLQKEPPVCPQCGIPALDDQSLFCTRCGARFTLQVVSRVPVCAGCGNTAPDPEAVFCNRCGTPFIRSGPPSSRQEKTVFPPAQPVIVAQKKNAGPQPRFSEPGVARDPVIRNPNGNNVSFPDPGLPGQYPNQPTGTGVQGDVKVQGDRDRTTSSKRFAHLPLIADELRADGATEPGVSNEFSPPKKGRDMPQKRGILGLLKKQQQNR